MKDELTPKQERFVQNIVSGMSQRQAYKESYNAENMSDESIDVEACRLFKNPNVSLRYKELLEEIKDAAIMTATERMIWLTEVVKDIQREGVKVSTVEKDFIVGEGTADLNTKMKAIDILNKMSGEYTTKIEGNIGVSKLEDLL